MVEHQQISVQRHRAHQDVLQLALADQRARVGIAPVLQHVVEDPDTGGPRQFGKLAQRSLGRTAITLVHTDQDGAPFHADLAHRRGPRHLLFQRDGLRQRIEIERMDALCGNLPVEVARAGVERQERRQVHLAGQAVLARDDGGNGIEPQQHEVGEVVAGERLVLEMRVHQAETAQAQLAGAGAADVGQNELASVADDDVLDLAAAVEQHAELSPDLARQFRQMPGELGRNQLSLLHSAAPGGEQSPGLTGLQPCGVAGQLFSHWRACNMGATRPPLIHLAARDE